VPELLPPGDDGVSEIPQDVAETLLRALVWCGQQITDDERETAWAWVDDRRGDVEEMGS
jgi:hypothetical protein